MSTRQSDRYRRAAEEALGQLDWCIAYLRKIRKEKISAQLARNRSYISRELLREAEERPPSQSADKS